MSRNFSEEQPRHVRETMTEEELVIFDILTRPAPELSDADQLEVRLAKAGGQVEKLTPSSSPARGLTYRNDGGSATGTARAYDQPLYEQKCSVLFEHSYESYPSGMRAGMRPELDFRVRDFRSPSR